MSIFKRLFDPNERELRKLSPIVTAVSKLESDMRQLSDVELQAKTTEFQARYGKGESLDALLIEAFAVVRETARRVLDMRHFDVQIVGGAILHQGRIAEMQTGEGLSVVAT